jgi:lipoprotein NlpI
MPVHPADGPTCPIFLGVSLEFFMRHSFMRNIDQRGRKSARWLSRMAAWAALALACWTPGIGLSEEGLAAKSGDPSHLAKDLDSDLDAEIEALSAKLAKAPKEVELYSRRGDKYFFRGKFGPACADYEKMVALKPELDTSHWRLGIAYFYAREYGKAARQFEVYHSFDQVDRENGIWRYLSQYRAYGKEKAREDLLKYEKDDREPFPDLYKMFAGKLAGDDVLKKIESASIAADERDKRLFYAHLYVGLNDAVEGRGDSAAKHLEAAVKNRWGARAGGGPGHMWHVGRLHRLELIEQSLRNEKSQP